MFCNLPSWIRIVLAIAVAFAAAYLFTPQCKKFALSVGAVDQPSERRINDHPVPRMGGIAIFCGFVLAMLLFADLTPQTEGILIGTIIIAFMGGIDDMYNLSPWIKFIGQFAAAGIAIACGVVVDGFTNFKTFGDTVYLTNITAVVVTAIWIVGCTNAINFIDGLDGLAVGMTTISSTTLLLISLRVSDPNISVILACLIGACIGFLPYNWNPAKIFMGDVGSQMLGFVLSTVSVIGLFKIHALVTILLPLLAMAVPLADTAFAIIRRLSKGQSPFKADKGHFHHRLLALGLNQKQVVTLLYAISVVLGLFAYFMVGSTRTVKIICLALAFIIVFCIVLFVSKIYPRKKHKQAQNIDAQESDVKIYNKKK